MSGSPLPNAPKKALIVKQPTESVEAFYDRCDTEGIGKRFTGSQRKYRMRVLRDPETGVYENEQVELDRKYNPSTPCPEADAAQAMRPAMVNPYAIQQRALELEEELAKRNAKAAEEHKANMELRNELADKEGRLRSLELENQQLRASRLESGTVSLPAPEITEGKDGAEADNAGASSSENAEGGTEENGNAVNWDHVLLATTVPDLKMLCEITDTDVSGVSRKDGFIEKLAALPTEKLAEAYDMLQAEKALPKSAPADEPKSE